MSTELLASLDADSRKSAVWTMDSLGALDGTIDNPQAELCWYNMTRILREVKQFLLPCAQELIYRADIDFPIADIEHGIVLIEASIERLPAITQMRSVVMPGLAGRKLMQGFMGRFPVYCLLPYLPRLDRRIDIFRQYKSLILICSHVLKINSLKVNRDYQSAVTLAADAIRKIVNSQFLDALPRLDSPNILQAQNVIDNLRQSSPFNSIENEFLRAIHALLRFLLEANGEYQSADNQISHPVDTTEKQGTSSIRITRLSGTNSVNLREAVLSGLAPAELAGDVELISESAEADDEEPPITAPATTLARQAMSRQRRLDAIEKGAQLLPHSISRLPPVEHAVFMALLRVSAMGNSALPNDLQTQAAVALNTSYWLSKKLSTTLGLVIYADLAQLPKTIPAGFLGYIQSTREWVIPALRPKGEPKYLDADLSLAVHTSATVMLPDVAGSYQFLEKLKAWELATIHGNARAFSCSGADIQAKCQYLLGRVASKCGARVTWARLTDALFFAVLDECGDKALASLVLARPHRLSDTQLHYTTAREQRLRQIYASACARINNEGALELPNQARAATFWAEEGEFTGKSVGCPICPKDGVISRVAAELVQALECLRNTQDSLAQQIDFFNLYTAYVVFQLQHLTGIRAVTKPIPSEAHIDFTNRILLASDKDDYTSFNTRLIPLPGIVHEQLTLYLRHQQALQIKLEMLDKNAKGNEGKLETSGLFYFLKLIDGQVQVHPCKPTEIQLLIRQHVPWFNLPANCQRASLRSRLLRDQCPSQWIDALLGHWTRGEEPWHRFNSTALATVIEGLRSYLDALARADGWIAVRGSV